MCSSLGIDRLDYLLLSFFGQDFTGILNVLKSSFIHVNSMRRTKAVRCANASKIVEILTNHCPVETFDSTY